MAWPAGAPRRTPLFARARRTLVRRTLGGDLDRRIEVEVRLEIEAHVVAAREHALQRTRVGARRLEVQASLLVGEA